MDASTFDKKTLIPALDWFRNLVVEVPVKRDSHVLIHAICGQESNWTERLQKPVPYAHGFAQFERMGGVKGVLQHPATKAIAKRLCDNYNIPATPTGVWVTIGLPEGDNLAIAFARLLLFTDPRPLPAVGDVEASREYYERNWQPGKKDAERWRRVYPQSLKAVTT
jgi:hypothetical protein